DAVLHRELHAAIADVTPDLLEDARAVVGMDDVHDRVEGAWEGSGLEPEELLHLRRPAHLVGREVHGPESDARGAEAHDELVGVERAVRRHRANDLPSGSKCHLFGTARRAMARAD